MNKPFQSFSPKQLAVLTWWCAPERAERYNGIICDGAVRSGKTLCMSISFIAWAMHGFADTSFALCGKTVTSLRRNVVTPLLPVLRALGFACRDRLSRNMIEIQKDGRENRFYLFGGKDESSAALIQGITLGGVLFDEVALMPRSFVEQALARCSLGGAQDYYNEDLLYQLFGVNAELLIDHAWGWEPCTIADIKASGELVVATSANFPPFEYKEGSEFVGWDMDIARYFAAKLGVELVVVDTDFDGVLSGVAAGKAHIGMAGISQNPTRDETLDFSDDVFDSLFKSSFLTDEIELVRLLRFLLP